jgi:acyl dehydratase
MCSQDACRTGLRRYLLRMVDPPPANPTHVKGRFFDQLEVGEIFVSQARTITEADVVHFAGVSGDYNPLHTDHEYASGTVFRGRIAHGLLVQSVASGLAWQLGLFDGTIAALKEMVIRFQSPVLLGDTVRLDLKVAEKDPEPSSRRGWIRFEAKIVNQRGDTVIDGSWTTLMHRRADRRRELTREGAS